MNKQRFSLIFGCKMVLQVLTKTSSSSLAAFQESKEQFEREQLDIIHRAAESVSPYFAKIL